MVHGFEQIVHWLTDTIPVLNYKCASKTCFFCVAENVLHFMISTVNVFVVTQNQDHEIPEILFTKWRAGTLREDSH